MQYPMIKAPGLHERVHFILPGPNAHDEVVFKIAEAVWKEAKIRMYGELSGHQEQMNWHWKEMAQSFLDESKGAKVFAESWEEFVAWVAAKRDNHSDTPAKFRQEQLVMLLTNEYDHVVAVYKVLLEFDVAIMVESQVQDMQHEGKTLHGALRNLPCRPQSPSQGRLDLQRERCLGSIRDPGKR